MPIEEDGGGTHIFNSKDLRLIEHIPALVSLGVDSLKIEGRMKSAYYVATVVRAYRQALDLYARDPEGYELPQELLDELEKVSHRPYWAGFFAPSDAGIFRPSSANIRHFDVVGVVESYDEERKEALVGVRNRLPQGAEVEVLQPRGPVFKAVVSRLIEEDTGTELEAAHANYRVRIPMEQVQPYSMLRMKVE